MRPVCPRVGNLAQFLINTYGRQGVSWFWYETTQSGAAVRLSPWLRPFCEWPPPPRPPPGVALRLAPGRSSSASALRCSATRRCSAAAWASTTGRCSFRPARHRIEIECPDCLCRRWPSARAHGDLPPRGGCKPELALVDSLPTRAALSRVDPSHASGVATLRRTREGWGRGMALSIGVTAAGRVPRLRRRTSQRTARSCSATWKKTRWTRSSSSVRPAILSYIWAQRSGPLELKVGSVERFPPPARRIGLS